MPRMISRAFARIRLAYLAASSVDGTPHPWTLALLAPAAAALPLAMAWQSMPACPV